jgi:hypothetical protein
MDNTTDVGKKRKLAGATRAVSAILLSTCALSNCSRISPAAKESTPSETAKSKRVSVGISDSKVPFDDDLLITLHRTNYKNSEWKVYATIRSPNHVPFKIEDKGIEFSTPYRGKNDYTIHILSADELQATFLVIRSEVTPEATQPSGDDWFWIRVKENKPAVFDNGWSIKLINILGEGAQRKVSLIILSSRHGEILIERVGIDFSITFSGQDGYVIHLVDASDKTAGGDKTADFVIARGKHS